MVNILYLSVHDILEYNELQVLKGLGCNVKSLGFLTDPLNPTSTNIGPVPFLDIDQDFINKAKSFLPPDPRTPYRITDPSILKDIDLVIVCHSLEHLSLNADLFKGKKVIRRTVSQGNSVYEQSFKPFIDGGLKVVRFSSRENKIPNFQGFDWVIRPCVSALKYSADTWTGEHQRLLTVKSSALKLALATQFYLYKELTWNGSLLPDTFVGNNNEDVPGCIGKVSDEQLKFLMANHRVGFCLPSRPGSITYTMIEYMMSGLPIAAFGPILGNSSHPIEGPTYEIHELISNGVDGYCSDNIRDLRNYIFELFNNKALAKNIGLAGRKTAEKLFSYETASEGWKQVLKDI